MKEFIIIVAHCTVGIVAGMLNYRTTLRIRRPGRAGRWTDVVLSK